MWTAASYDLRTGEWWRLCDLKDGVSYPGLASDGSYIYIFENRNLQVYHIETDTMRIYELGYFGCGKCRTFLLEEYALHRWVGVTVKGYM